MEAICHEQDQSWVSLKNPSSIINNTHQNHHQQQQKEEDDVTSIHYNNNNIEETDQTWKSINKKTTTTTTTTKKKKTNKKKPQVLLEGYVVETSNEGNNKEDDLKRTKSLTDEDLDELKGCLDLGFGFSYNEIPELCNTLPALELCYSMSQKYLDDRAPPASLSPTCDAVSSDLGTGTVTAAAAAAASSSPVANWKISSPGDHPEDVKARLKFWAQTVACTVRLCS